MGDDRVLRSLHRRVFLQKVTSEAPGFFRTSIRLDVASPPPPP
jgi:hypothetical protein